jgi:hypothetical protein
MYLHMYIQEILDLQSQFYVCAVQSELLIFMHDKIYNAAIIACMYVI